MASKAQPLTNPVVDGILQCFHTVHTRMYVSLAPQYLESPIDGIKQQHLDEMIMSYNTKAGGVVVGYDNISIENTNPDGGDLLLPIDGSTPFSFFWIGVDLLVWTPQIGDVLEGHIYMQTASHLGLLVHDTFNALIKKYNIPAGWQFQPSDADERTDLRFGVWVDEEGATVEGKLQFTVSVIHSLGRVVSLEGTLVDASAESDAQPVTSSKHAATNKHVKFDDSTPEPLPEVVQKEAEDDEMIPEWEEEDSD